MKYSTVAAACVLVTIALTSVGYTQAQALGYSPYSLQGQTGLGINNLYVLVGVLFLFMMMSGNLSTNWFTSGSSLSSGLFGASSFSGASTSAAGLPITIIQG